MKKISLVLLFSIACFTTAFSQIKREVYGIKMGSTIEQANSVLKEKGLSLRKSSMEYGTFYIASGDIYFAGVSWESVGFLALDGKVCAIMFNYTNSNPASAATDASKLMTNLGEKYDNYAHEPEMERNGNNLEFSAKMSDDDTLIAFSGSLKEHGESSLSLVYSDISSIKQIKKNELDDL